MQMLGEGSRETVCSQLEGLLIIVVKFKEEVERLSSIRACEQEIDWWGSALGVPRVCWSPCPVIYWAEVGDQKDEEG